MDLAPKMLALIDTLFLFFSIIVAFSALIGFSIYESGLITAKNASSIIAKKIGALSVSALLFLAIAYRLMFATDSEGAAVFPFLDAAWTWKLWRYSADKGETLAHFYSNFTFQWLFAALNIVIIAGAVVERMRLFGFLLFTVVMSGFIYPIVGHWVWNTGFLYRAGFSDFAGASVVHLTAACAGLSGTLMLGSRMGKYTLTKHPLSIRGSNLPLAALGALFIWLGFLGLNCGAELSFSHLKDADNVMTILVSTLMAGSGGLIAALLFSRILFSKTDLTLMLNGLISGLVAISANPIIVHMEVTPLLGAAAALISMLLIFILERLRVDDPVGVVSVHGGGALVGLLAVPLFDKDISFSIQLIGVLVIGIFTFTVTGLVWWLVKLLMGLRISEADEIAGLDVVDCGLEAYPEFIKTR